MESIEIWASAIHGQGAFAARPIAKGSVILAIDDSVVIGRDDPDSDELLGAETDYCDYLPDGTVILMQVPERHINHSCSPNVYIRSAAGERFILAMDDIAEGDELGFDYAIGLVNGDLLECIVVLPSAEELTALTSSSYQRRSSWRTCPASTDPSSHATKRGSTIYCGGDCHRDVSVHSEDRCRTCV